MIHHEISPKSANPTPQRIAVIDDHNLVLDGLKKTLAGMDGNYDVVSAASPTEILNRLQAGETFDLCICDLIMEGMNGLAFLATLNARQCQIPVLLMSGIAVDPPIQQMKSLGAKGFVHKSADPQTLETIIQTILSDGTSFPDDDAIEDQPTIAPFDMAELDAINNLTARQLDVLKALANGAINQEISEQLSISPNTVKTHIQHLYKAMGVSRRTACVQKAQLYGII